MRRFIKTVQVDGVRRHASSYENLAMQMRGRVILEVSSPCECLGDEGKVYTILVDSGRVTLVFVWADFSS